MTEMEIKLIQRLKSLLDIRLKGYEIIAFGSRARGDSQEDSDLDLLVITDNPRTPTLRKFVSECAWEAGFESGIVISTLLVSRKNWETGPQRSSLLARAVLREGVTV
jgi:predicted nucleotidyltransferase